MSRFVSSRKTREKLSESAKRSPWSGGFRKKKQPPQDDDGFNFGACPFIPAPATVPEDLMAKYRLQN